MAIITQYKGLECHANKWTLMPYFQLEEKENNRRTLVLKHGLSKERSCRET